DRGRAAAQGLLQAPLADEAPRADHVGDDVDGQHQASFSRLTTASPTAAALAGFWPVISRPSWTTWLLKGMPDLPYLAPRFFNSSSRLYGTAFSRFTSSSSFHEKPVRSFPSIS